VRPDSRLSAVAGFVKGNVLCDVGTDHGKLPISLLKRGQCSRAVLTDINSGPLETAKKNAVSAKVTEHIEFLQTDGLDGVELTDITDIVIAGMGGELIADILARDKRRITGKNLILQPMTKREYLLAFLLKNGFRIIGRKRVSDGKKTYEIYNVMLVKKMATIKAVYEALDTIAPFSDAENWDNSGLLVGDLSDREVHRAIVALDISFAVVQEALEKNCDLIISHHPVIFHPLTKLVPRDPAVYAARNGICCICTHTSFDCAEMGMNNVFVPLFCSAFNIDHVFNKKPVEPIGNTDSNNGIGIVFELPKELLITAKDFASRLKTMFGSGVVKYTDPGKPSASCDLLHIKKVAFCSGSGGEYLSKVMSTPAADVYITSDLKHNHFVDAKGRDFAVFDCGHYATEAIMKPYAAEFLKAQFPDMEVILSEADIDPANII
jgi:dinuclear metal center YbgI/SA1388 family protein